MTQCGWRDVKIQELTVHTGLTSKERSRPLKLIGTGLPVFWGSLKPVLNWANVCSPNILRTLRRTMIRFLIELLVRRTWFGHFDELYFVLNWLVMRCKLRPELAADAQQTA